MSQSEVFRPMNGPLLVRGNIAHGLPQATDTFRRSSGSGNRPSTQGGYRFGQLSQNSFFARHNPHPSRVRHMKGLLDVPICSVSDEGFFSNPRYSLNFPPNNHNQNRINSFSKYYNMPVNSINVNSQTHPINTITGLQWFMGKPLNLKFHREKAIPKMGMVPVTEAWRDELQALTEAIGLPNAGKKDNGVVPRRGTAGERRNTAERKTTAEGRPRTQYSETTGRIMPPPSRAMSRGYSRQSRREQALGQLSHIMTEPDTESVILQMLCQILQTDDVNAVQAWLVSAGDSEKSMVLDMIKSAMSSNEEYYKQHDAEYVPERPRTSPEEQAKDFFPDGKPGEEDINKVIDRLTLEEVSPRPLSAVKEEDNIVRYTYTPIGNRQDTPKYDAHCFDDMMKPPMTADVFRPSKSRQSDRPKSGLARPKSASKPSSPVNLNTEVRLRYTRTPVMDQDLPTQKQSLMDVLGTGDMEQATWKPAMSTV